jgi:hypothetical protein
MRNVRLFAFVGAVICLGLVAGAFAVFSEVEAGNCRCPAIWAPVICDNGKTYPNQCYADCQHARNCVPSGGV